MTVAFQWFLVVLYLALFCLVLVNIRMILIKLQKWKSLALLFFYIWSFLSISARLFCNIYGNFMKSSYALEIGLGQVTAKLCAGIMQTWIITELAIRIYCNMRGTIDQTKMNKLLIWGELGVVILTASIFIGLITANAIMGDD